MQWLLFILTLGIVGGGQATPVASEGEKGIEAYFQPSVDACKALDDKACLRLAYRLSYVSNDRESRFISSPFSKACDEKLPGACAGLAVAFLQGIIERPREARVSALLKQSCDAKIPLACGQLAELAINQKDKEAGSAKTGLRLAQETCKALGGYPCMTVATTLQQDPAQAQQVAKLYERACDGGDAIACYQFGLAKSQGYLGLKSDQDAATKLYEKACARDMPQACFNLGWQYLRGTGASNDEKIGLSFVEKSCRLGDSAGCDELHRRKPDAEYFCNLWGARACFDLAAKLSADHGETAEFAEAITLAGLKACRRRDDSACRLLKHLVKDAIRSCDAGDKPRDTCMFAGVAYANQLDPEEQMSSSSVDKASLAFAKACKAGAKVACQRKSQP